MKSQIADLVDQINGQGFVLRSEFIEYVTKERNQKMDQGLFHARIKAFNDDPAKFGFPYRVNIRKTKFNKDQILSFTVKTYV
ncbi:hypothetical protein EB118_10410 [bacterium]|nr:hypothetical protein [bacterium]